MLWICYQKGFIVKYIEGHQREYACFGSVHRLEHHAKNKAHPVVNIKIIYFVTQLK